MKLFFKNLAFLVRETLREIKNHNIFRHAAGLSYYTIFSLPAILFIMISLAGPIFGKAEIQDALLTEIGKLVGESSEQQVALMLDSVLDSKGDAWWHTLLGLAVLVFGSSAVFFHLQDSINTLWNIRHQKMRNFWVNLKDRMLSLGMILIIGFLLLVSLVVETALVAIHHWLSEFLPAESFYPLLFLDIILSFGTIAALFTLLYKYLPDGIIRWKDALIGALFTGVLFVIGELLIGLYIGNLDFASKYGAAGSLIVMMMWVYYSALTLMVGALFTAEYCKHFGQEIRLKESGVWLKKG